MELELNCVRLSWHICRAHIMLRVVCEAKALMTTIYGIRSLLATRRAQQSRQPIRDIKHNETNAFFCAGDKIFGAAGLSMGGGKAGGGGHFLKSITHRDKYLYSH